MSINRKLDIVVISDVFLGSSIDGPEKLLHYLNSIEPRHLVLNGNIIDVSKFRNSYSNPLNLEIIKKLLSFSENGTKVTYIKGYKDYNVELLLNEKHTNFSIVKELLLDIDGKKALFFNGHILANWMRLSKWISILNPWKYHLFTAFYQLHIKLNTLYNFINKTRKHAEESNSKHVNIGFEKTAIKWAIHKGLDYIIGGHTHCPDIKIKQSKHGSTTYLNSGDWVTNFTTLEYRLKRWKLYDYSKDRLVGIEPVKITKLKANADLQAVLD